MRYPGKVSALIGVAALVSIIPHEAAAEDFVVVVESVENFPELSRDYADWHMSLKRISKTEKVIDGYYTVKKDIVRPKAEMETFYLKNNKFLKVDINHPKRDLCGNETAAFIAEYFVGNSTRTEDCVIRPGHMVMKKDKKLDMNEIAHKEYKKVFFATFRIIVTVTNESDDVVGKVAWVVTAKKKT